MKTRFSLAAAALLLFAANATPLVAQEAEAAKKEAAEQADMKKAQAEMKAEGAEGCQCKCMQEGHAEMMEAHAEGEAHAAMAEGADGEAMKEAHAGMMKGCKCMMHTEGEGSGEAMQCRMHSGEGEMKGEGMQHRHGAPETEESAAEDASEG